MYKLNSKDGTIIEISNLEFSNLFKLNSPKIPIAVLTEAQSVANLNDFFYSPNFELLEYIRDCSDQLKYSQLDMFTLGEVPFFGTDNRVFSEFIRDLISQDLPNGLHFDFLTSDSLDKWPWTSNLSGWMRDPNVSKLPAFKSLLKYDASGAVNILSVCESLLNRRCCEFQITDVIESLKKIETANRDELLDLKIPLPNNQFLKIESPIGLTPSKYSQLQTDGCFIEWSESFQHYWLTGLDFGFAKSFREEWCDLKFKRFLITSTYSNLAPHLPIKSMIYVIDPIARKTNMELLLNTHKYLLKDHFLRLVVCLKSQAQDFVSSFLPTNEIFTGVNRQKQGDRFFRRPSLDLEESLILDPLFQTTMDVKANELERLYSIFQNRTSAITFELIPTFIGQNADQVVKFETLKMFSPRSKMPHRHIIK